MGFLQRFDFFGIYVVMFMEILSTLVRVIIVFSVLIVAFGMSFYIIFAQQESSPEYKDPWLSLSTTVVMMLGGIEYVDSWILPYTEQSSVYPALSFLMLTCFILLMPVLLINLLIGLAVGDIGAVLKNARLKRLAMQVQIHTDWEKKMPKKITTEV